MHFTDMEAEVCGGSVTCPKLHKARFEPWIVTSSQCSFHNMRPRPSMVTVWFRGKRTEQPRLKSGNKETWALSEATACTGLLAVQRLVFLPHDATQCGTGRGSLGGTQRENQDSVLGCESLSEVWGKGKLLRRQGHPEGEASRETFLDVSPREFLRLALHCSPLPPPFYSTTWGSLNWAANCQFSRNGNEWRARGPVYIQLQGVSFAAEKCKPQPKPSVYVEMLVQVSRDSLRINTLQISSGKTSSVSPYCDLRRPRWLGWVSERTLWE